MSRMDRYKDIHKKAKPLKRDTGSIFARRERKRTRMENEEDATRIYEREQHSFEHLNQYEQQIYRDAPRAEEQTVKTSKKAIVEKNHSIDFACFDPLFRYLIFYW